MRWSVLACVLCGCGVAELSESGDTLGASQQKEAWSGADSPFLFDASLETRLDALPSSGEAAQVPWAGSYWPVVNDTINYRWSAASESAAKKYERAFGGSGVEEAVSRAHGIEGATAQRACSSDAQCTASRGERCAKRAGRASGRCIPTWWGICHAWAPAAILWPEPRVAVTRAGVRFEVQDLKALASLVHDRTATKFVSLRCEANAPSFVFDWYGRPTGGECRDTNAGTYHVLLANYLGRRRQSFVVDRTVDDEVWNQPLRSFRVVAKREVTAAEANRLLGATGASYAFNTAARRWVAVTTEVRWITESDPSEGFVGAARIDAFTRSDRYEYVLELDAAGKIIGGEWVGASRTSHPDFAWLPLGPGAESVAGGAIRYEMVKDLVMESAAGGGSGSEGFALASGAWKVLGPFTVPAGLSTVELSGTGDADLYVRMGAAPTGAVFDCRPWLSSSRESCTVRGPGQLFVAVSAATAATVTVRVRSGGAAALLTTSGTVRAAETKVFTVPVTAGRAVVVRTASGGDVDLLVRMGSAPTVAEYDARALGPTGNETLRFVPRVSGSLRVGVRGYVAASFTLSVTEE